MSYLRKKRDEWAYQMDKLSDRIEELEHVLKQIAAMDPKNQNPGIWPARNLARDTVAEHNNVNEDKK